METGQKKKRRFTKKQLRATQGMLTQQAKTNIYANQAGMTAFGAVRHGKDIAVKELYEEGPDDEYPPDEDEPTPVVSRASRRAYEPEPEPVRQPEPAADDDDEGY